MSTHRPPGDRDAPRTDYDAVAPSEVVERAFGAENRARLLEAYFTTGVGNDATLTVDNAWQHVYRLLLWIDRTTNLAHCYESDKCQPGRPWYARSLAFHSWLADAFGVSPAVVEGEIDALFKHVTRDLAATAAARVSERARSAASQRKPYEDRDFPRPGEDPELEAIITATLAPYLSSPPPPAVLRTLTEQVQAYFALENKRKNLVGEGFEDSLAAVLRRIPGITDRYDVRVRPLLHELPGFHLPRGEEKPKRVDLVLLNRSSGRRILISCKWSVRSDREEQFGNDFRAYSQLEAHGQDFEYILITNEFDPARLAAACTMRRENALLFSEVIHVNPDGPRAAYVGARAPGRNSGTVRTLAHIESGRLTGLRQWLARLASPE